MRFYNHTERRLIYCDTPATAAFWDSNWSGQRLTREELQSQEPTTWSRITQEFLSPKDGPLLEGGCGTGIQVAAINNAGYSIVGIDFATETVRELNNVAPELDIRIGDVRKLDFDDQTFAGYWSLGVIEHFWDGYAEIADEGFRVLKPGGMMFLVFPYLNPVRAWKG